MAESSSTLSETDLVPKELKLLLRYRGMTDAEKKLFMSLMRRKAFQTQEEMFRFLYFAEERDLSVNEALSLFPNLGGAL